MKRKSLSKPIFYTLVFYAAFSNNPLIAAPVPNGSAQETVLDDQSIILTKSDSVEGKVLNRSKKARVIALRTQGRIEIVNYDAETIGIEHARKNENIIVSTKLKGLKRVAESITPGLAKVPAGVEEIEIDELVERIDGGNRDFILMDARALQRYNEGHIPSAISIPLQSLQTNEQLLTTLAVDKEKELIIYSDGTTCGLCTGVAQIAVKQGYKNVKVLLVGVQSWEDEGEVLAVSDSLLKDNSSIVIDLRGKGKLASGYIPGAISITLEEMSDEEMSLDFPTDRSAPIVFYGNETQIAEAVAVTGEWGYWQLRQVDGGYSGWLERGHDVSTGIAPGVEGISWTPRISRNQISRQDFKKLMADIPDDTIILDVRSDKETQKGHIKSSLHIALEDLTERVSLIPADKKIIAHCATGSRAEVAAQFLGQYREDVRFLSAKVRCKGEKCRVR